MGASLQNCSSVSAAGVVEEISSRRTSLLTELETISHRVPVPACIEDSQAQIRESIQALRDARKQAHELLGFEREDSWEDIIETPGQEHVFDCFDELPSEEKVLLQEAVANFADDRLEKCLEEALERARSMSQDMDAFEPPTELSWVLKRPPRLMEGANVSTLSSVRPSRAELWRHRGFEMLAQGEVAVLIMAGGDNSTRLSPLSPITPGVEGAAAIPFGAGRMQLLWDIGLPSHKTILQLYCERVRRLEHIMQRVSNGNLEQKISQDPKDAKKKGLLKPDGTPAYEKIPLPPIYIMANTWEARDLQRFLEKNAYFGLPKAVFTIFDQANWPMVSVQGKLLMANRSSILERPAGSGGVFLALEPEGVLQDMKSRGVRSLLIMSADNVLARIADPVFLGHCSSMHAQVGIKCIERESPEEKLGLLTTRSVERYVDADKDGDLDEVIELRPYVVEHHEVPFTMAYRRGATPDREWHFFSANMSHYYFTLRAVEGAIRHQDHHWHVHEMSVPHFSMSKRRLVKSPPNGEINAYRMETLVFDTFVDNRRVAGLLVNRDEEFARIRTAAESIRAVSTVSLLHQRWILEAGGCFASNYFAGMSKETSCEISPLVTYGGEHMKASVGTTPLRLPLVLNAFGEDQVQEMEGLANAHDCAVAWRVVKPDNRGALLKLKPWESISEQPVLAGPLAIPPPKKDEGEGEDQKEDKEARRKGSKEKAGEKAVVMKEQFEQAHVDLAETGEKLPPTPRWLKDQEDKWQDKVQKAFNEVARQREIARLRALGADNDPEVQAEIARLLAKSAGTSMKELQKQKRSKDDVRPDRKRTLASRPERPDSPSEIVYGMPRYYGIIKDEEPMVKAAGGRSAVVMGQGGQRNSVGRNSMMSSMERNSMMSSMGRNSTSVTGSLNSNPTRDSLAKRK